MKRLLALTLLLLSGWAQAQTLVNCATGTACTTSGPSNTGTGDPAWLAFGEINQNFISLMGSQSQNLLWATPNGSTGSPGFRSIALTDLPGVTIRYPGAASVTITSTDNGNVVNQNVVGGCAIKLEQIGAAGINAGAFQTIIVNSGLNNCSIAPDTGVTSTINGSSSSIFLPSGGWYSIIADNTSSPGNYQAIIGGGFTSSNQGTLSFPNGIKANSLVVNSTSTRVSGQGWIDQDASHHVELGTDLNPGCLIDGNQNIECYQTYVSQMAAGLSVYPAIALGGNCSGPTDDTNAALTGVVVTASSPTITNTGTNGFAAGDSVYLSGTIPTGFNAIPSPAGPATPYYVTNVNSVLTTTSFQLSATSGTSGAAITPSSGSTGNATVITKISGVYQHSGGPFSGWFKMPSSGTYNAGACTATLTWPNFSSPTNPGGYKCSGTDETAASQLTQTTHSGKVATLSKATTFASGDVIGYQCIGTGGP